MNDFVRERVCFYGGCESVFETVDYAVRFGAAGIELMNFCEEFKTPDMKMAKEVSAVAKRYGLRLPCFSAGINFAEGDREKKLSRIKGYVDICSELEIPYMHHTLVIPLEEPEDYSFAVRIGIESAHEIYEYAKARGVQTILEEQGFVFNGVEGYRLLDNPLTRNCKTLLDVGNIMFVDECAEDFIDSYAERIVHVHLKDYVISDKPLKNSSVIKSLTHGDVYKSKGGKCLTACEIGTGDVNYPEISRKLKKIQYNGCYSLEFDTIPSDDEISRVLKNITKYFGE